MNHILRIILASACVAATTITAATNQICPDYAKLSALSQEEQLADQFILSPDAALQYTGQQRVTEIAKGINELTTYYQDALALGLNTITEKQAEVLEAIEQWLAYKPEMGTKLEEIQQRHQKLRDYLNLQTDQLDCAKLYTSIWDAQIEKYSGLWSLPQTLYPANSYQLNLWKAQIREYKQLSQEAKATIAKFSEALKLLDDVAKTFASRYLPAMPKVPLLMEEPPVVANTAQNQAANNWYLNKLMKGLSYLPM